MNPGQKQSKLSFEEVLQMFGVKRAFDKLVKDGADPRLLKYWLRDVATAPDKYGKRKGNKRKAAQLVRGARSLANKIDRAAESPLISFIGMATELHAMLELHRQLPDRLREYANCWENIIDWKNHMSRSRGPQSPRIDRICALLEIVKGCTGAYHYREVADLLNIMDMAYRRGDGGTHWGERNLGQLQHRARKRMTKALND